MFDQAIATVALVGCGAVSQQYYAPALQELERLQTLRVRALYDPDPDNLARLRQIFPTARCLGGLAELSPQRAELAIIASPPQHHSQQTIQLLQAGLSVLCEKPIATNVAAAEAMIAASAAAPGILAVGLFRRFFPATQTIHKILSLGLLGDISSFSFAEGGTFRWPVQSVAYFRKATANGGVLMDLGVHVLDLLIWWLGHPTEIVYEDDAMGGIEVNSRLQCQFSGGTTGEIRLSRDSDLSNRYVINGTKGWLIWEANEADRIQLGFADASFGLNGQIHDVLSQHPAPILGRPSFNFQQSFISQICHVIAAMRGSESLLVSGEQAIESLQLIETCYRQRTLLPMPWLSEGELSRARVLNEVHTL